MPPTFSICFLLADIFKHGIWSELESITDPELKVLAEFLPVAALQSRAPSTAKKYAGAFCRWRKWAATKPGVVPFPAKPIHVGLCLSFLIQKAKTPSPVEEAVNALSWAHNLACVEDPTGHPLVKQVLEGAKRILAHKVDKNEPITPEILRALVDKYAKEDATLANIRTLTICLLGFAGFFRYNELAKLKECDICFFTEHIEIFLESSKMDQYRDGSVIVIARMDTEYCPVAMLEHYMRLASISIEKASDKFLFRRLVNTKNGQKLRDSADLSYTRAHELVLAMLESIGLDRKQFSLHSLRSGGASAAANAGVPDRCFKRHGRWLSESAKDGYIQDKLEERLSVSKKLGL